MTKYNLAQLNIARMKAPIDDPLMADFAAQLDEVNALADNSPGFVWRLIGESGDATDIRSFNDPTILVNMSVWESVDALRSYAYQGRHLEVFQNRKQWFDRLDGPHMVLWWIPDGHIPTVAEAEEKLETLAHLGPTPTAFTFPKRFDPPMD